jgi:hypothetical protein
MFKYRLSLWWGVCGFMMCACLLGASVAMVVAGPLLWIRFSGVPLFPIAPIWSRLFGVVTSVTSLFGLSFFLLNIYWTVTGGRQITVSSAFVGVPPTWKRQPKLFPYAMISHIHLEEMPFAWFCTALTDAGKALFRLDSRRFVSRQDFDKLVALLSSRYETPVSVALDADRVNDTLRKVGDTAKTCPQCGRKCGGLARICPRCNSAFLE